MDAPNYFIPDRDPRTRAAYPLREFLRAPSLNVAQEYIETLTAPGDLIVDPFGAMPNVAYAAHALGRRAIVVASNPLWAWLARAMVSLPGENEINAALTKLGDAMKDDAPLRAHIAQLYVTTCAACGKTTPVDYFIHARDGGIIKRHYTCAHCGETRDDDATEDDVKRAQSFDAHGLHYHVAFERVAPEDKLFGERINKMLDVYTPRNLYALVTLTQKIDSLFRDSRERNILLLLLLHLLDHGTSFYESPDASAQLKSHKQFVEFNLWHEIEIAAHALAECEPLPLADSIADVVNAELPHVFVGRSNAQSLAREIPPHSVALVLSAQPTRRLGLLALSYFWGAWILGRNAVQALAPFLDSKKDFTWELRRYEQVLDEALNAISDWLRPDAHAVFAFDESRHLAIEALMMASANAKLNLESFVFQPRVGESARSEFGDLRGSYRIALRQSKRDGENGERELPSDDARELWRPATSANVNIGQLEKAIRVAALDAGKEILVRRGEPLAYSWLHHAAYTRLARDGLLAQAVEAKMKIPPGRFVHKAVVDGLSAGYAEDFDHHTTPTQFLWLRRAKLEPPLIDRVDDAVQEWLQSHRHFEEPPSGDEKSPSEQRDFSRQEPPLETLVPPARAGVTEEIYRQFPGDLTPEAGLIELCAAAYADVEHVVEERARAMEMLAKLGERLGFQVSGFRFQNSESSAIHSFDLVWLADGEIAHGFIWRERAQFADLTEIQVVPTHGYMIVPENLVALMQEKTRRLPHLAERFYDAGWNFVRIQSVEQLLQSEKIERHDLFLIIGLVPPRLGEATQLELFINNGG